MNAMNEKELRNLDAFIAEHVMGWEWYCAIGKAFLIPPFAHERFNDFSAHWTKGIYEKGWRRTEPEKKPCKKKLNIESYYSDYDYCSLPHYTTDPAAAISVLEKCAEKDTLVISRSTESEHPWVVVGRKTGHRSCHPTLPLAIALFAKKLHEPKT